MKQEVQLPKRKDSGFSLVELLVVIAIMAVCTGMVTLSFRVLSGRRAKQCRDELMTTLDGVRTATLGKKAVTAVITAGSDGYELTVESTADGTTTTTKSSKIAGESVTLYYAVTADGSDTSGWIEITGSNSLKLEFDRSSGALKAQGSGDTGSQVYHIFAVENNKTYGIRIYPETGKLMKE